MLRHHDGQNKYEAKESETDRSPRIEFLCHQTLDIDLTSDLWGKLFAHRPYKQQKQQQQQSVCVCYSDGHGAGLLDQLWSKLQSK